MIPGSPLSLVNYFKVSKLVFTPEMIVARHIPLSSLVLNFHSPSTEPLQQQLPTGLRRPCSYFSLTTAFPSPAFCAITHPSLAVTPGLVRSFPKPVQLTPTAANARFYLLGSFSGVFMSWMSSWRSQGRGEQWGMCGQEHGGGGSCWHCVAQ